MPNIPEEDGWTHHETVDAENFTITCTKCGSNETVFTVTNYPEGTFIYLWCKNCENNAILY